MKGIIFDMDGTLVEPAIDFGQMRSAVGVERGDILLTVRGWPEERRSWALEKIEEHEARAAAKMSLMPGALELMAWTERVGLRRGLVTRNNARTIQALSGLLAYEFSPSLDRSFEPCKPDPAALLHIVDVWGVSADEVVMVGDSRQDLDAARAARMRFCLVTQGYNVEYRAEADWVVSGLDELITLIEGA